MQADGVLVVHGDDRALIAACGGPGGRKVTFGLEKTNNLWASHIRTESGGVRFNLNGTRQEMFIPLLGRHVAVNALAAIAVARRMGVPDAAVFSGLAVAQGPAMRLEQRVMAGVRVINDAYNANPASLAAALQTVRDLPHAGGQKVAVLGDMLELGSESDHFHREAGRQAVAADLDLLICVGPGGSLIGASAVGNGMSGERVICYPDADTAAGHVNEAVRPGDLLLLKGSRGVGLERIAQALEPRMRLAV
jgi:UDP-N-acetylmuramoyl-tripeptide--D-alanyl-D-alanine ligase